MFFSISRRGIFYSFTPVPSLLLFVTYFYFSLHIVASSPSCCLVCCGRYLQAPGRRVDPPLPTASFAFLFLIGHYCRRTTCGAGVVGIRRGNISTEINKNVLA
uniref:Uncharacterized protein n=1 Tax=Trypanosoma congolense (strain IL3000) TaxID=1068625 RepID=G0UZ74_TRYCI|nr:hypothetical protein, unlikely [Trypanosoma congolense IL3000]